MEMLDSMAKQFAVSGAIRGTTSYQRKTLEKAETLREASRRYDLVEEMLKVPTTMNPASYGEELAQLLVAYKEENDDGIEEV